MKQKSMFIALLICLMGMFLLIKPYQQVIGFADQISSERFLSENRFFINYINIAVTNFGTDEEVKIFKKSAQHDFWAQVSFLQSEYKRTYTEIRLSQEQQVDLYNRIIDIYLNDAKKILDRIAPDIIRSKDSKARLYLSLGYRDLTEAKGQQVIAIHSSKKLFSYKIKRFMEGIKLSRRAKRYGILSIIQARTPREKKLEVDNLSFEEIGAKLRALQEKNDLQVQAEYRLIMHHLDNNGLSVKKETVKDKVGKEFQVPGYNPKLTVEEKTGLPDKKDK